MGIFGRFGISKSSLSFYRKGRVGKDHKDLKDEIDKVVCKGHCGRGAR